MNNLISFFLLLLLFLAYLMTKHLQSPAVLLVIFYVLLILSIGIERRLVIFVVLIPLFFSKPLVTVEINGLFLYDSVLVLIAVVSTFVLLDRNEFKIQLRRGVLIPVSFFFFIVGKLFLSGVSIEALRTAQFSMYPLYLLLIFNAFLKNNNGTSLTIKKFFNLNIIKVSILLLGLFYWVLIMHILIGGPESVLEVTRRQLMVKLGLYNYLPFPILLALIVLFLYYLYEKSPYFLLVTPIIIYDYVSYFNRSLFISIIGAVILIYLIEKINKRVFFVLFALLVFIILFSISDIAHYFSGSHSGSSMWRLIAWKSSIDSILTLPLGADLSKNMIDSASLYNTSNLLLASEARYVHNSYLTMLFYYGWFAGGGLIYFILNTLYQNYNIYLNTRNRQDKAILAVLLGAIIYGNFNVVIETPVEGILFWFIVLLGYANIKNKKVKFQ
jgi:hypothetical protein